MCVNSIYYSITIHSKRVLIFIYLFFLLFFFLLLFLRGKILNSFQFNLRNSIFYLRYLYYFPFFFGLLWFFLFTLYLYAQTQLKKKRNKKYYIIDHRNFAFKIVSINILVYLQKSKKIKKYK